MPTSKSDIRNYRPSAKMHALLRIFQRRSTRASIHYALKCLDRRFAIHVCHTHVAHRRTSCRLYVFCVASLRREPFEKLVLAADALSMPVPSVPKRPVVHWLNNRPCLQSDTMSHGATIERGASSGMMLAAAEAASGQADSSNSSDHCRCVSSSKLEKCKHEMKRRLRASSASGLEAEAGEAQAGRGLARSAH